MSGPPINVSDEAFAYLRLQKGKLDRFSHDRQRWEAEYRADLERTFDELKPFLPPKCWALLDIGSGLGGIDVLLYRWFATEPFVKLLDGADDPPTMKLHRETFSNERVARAFLRANGVRADRIQYYTPAATTAELCAPFDLVLSLGSWCFHYEPNTYLPRLMAGGGLHHDTRVIVDLRRGRGWEQQLWAAGFRSIAIVRESAKFQRIVWALA